MSDSAGNPCFAVGHDRRHQGLLNSYSYNTLCELTMLQQTQQTGGNTVAGKELDYAYNGLGLVSSRAAYTFLGTGPRTDVADGAYSYTTKGLLSSLIYTSHTGQVAIDSLGYTYDPLARVSTFTTIDGTATFGYDPTSQLTSATYVAATGGHEPANLSVAFDPNGNRTSTNGVSSTVGADNHISSDGTFNFTFDNAGNLSSRIRISNAPANDYKTVYLLDYRNRLTDVEFFNNSGTLTQHVHYVYDVWDHLIERDLDSTGGGTYTQIVHYVWDQGGNAADNIVLAFNGQQQLIARYVNDPNTNAFDQYYTTLAEEDVTSLTSAGPTTFDLPDPQGSVTDIVDSNGNPIDHIVYAPFGAVAYESNPAVLHLTSWQGGILDPVTGNVLFGERWEDVVHGFWLSQDPLGFTAGDMNLSRYVFDDPPNSTDPSGLKNVPLSDPFENAGRFTPPPREPPDIWDKLFPEVDPSDMLSPIGMGAKPVKMGLRGLGKLLKGARTAAKAAPVVEKVVQKTPQSLKEAKTTTKIIIDGAKHPESAKHAKDAIEAGVSNTGKLDRAGAKTRRTKRMKDIESCPKMDRDEFPPAVLDNGSKPASVRPVTSGDNRGAGAAIGQQLRGVPNGAPVEIVPINVPKE